MRRDVQQRRTPILTATDPSPASTRTARDRSKSIPDRSISISSSSSSRRRFEGSVSAAPPTSTRRGRDEAPEYSRDPSDQEVLDGAGLGDIVRLLQAREVHRINAQFAAADELRLELRDKYRVQCDDQQRTWRVLTAFKPDGTRRLQ